MGPKEPKGTKSAPESHIMDTDILTILAIFDAIILGPIHFHDKTNNSKILTYIFIM